MAVREGALAAITGTASGSATRRGPRGEIRNTLEYAAQHPEVLGVDETRLLTSWLRTLAGTDALDD